MTSFVGFLFLSFGCLRQLKLDNISSLVLFFFSRSRFFSSSLSLVFFLLSLSAALALFLSLSLCVCYYLCMFVCVRPIAPTLPQSSQEPATRVQEKNVVCRRGCRRHRRRRFLFFSRYILYILRTDDADDRREEKTKRTASFIAFLF